MSEATPCALLWQKLAKQIGRTHWSQQQEQRGAQELRRAPFPPATGAAMSRKRHANVLVGNKWREQFEQGRGAGGGESHDPSKARKTVQMQAKTSGSQFFSANDSPTGDCYSFRNTLRSGEFIRGTVAAKWASPLDHL
jgi:hypothetical protein